jgi:hypothetical protein
MGDCVRRAPWHSGVFRSMNNPKQPRNACSREPPASVLTLVELFWIISMRTSIAAHSPIKG